MTGDKENGVVVGIFTPNEYRIVLRALGEYEEYLEANERFADAAETKRLRDQMYEVEKEV